MKRILLGAMFSMLIAGVAVAGIVNSKHDLSTGSVNTTKSNSTDLCVFCHTPHLGSTTSLAPLWNRTANSTTWTNANPYSSASMNTTANAGTGAYSAVCLGCHDGSVGDETLLNGPGSGTATTITWSNGNFATVGNLNDAGGLTNDHPIGVNVTAAIAGGDTGLFTVASITSGANALMLYNGGAASAAAGDVVECASCHSVHNATAFAPMLRVSNASSGMCIKCHNK